MRLSGFETSQRLATRLTPPFASKRRIDQGSVNDTDYGELDEAVDVVVETLPQALAVVFAQAEA